MNYISEKQFLDQSEDIQKVLVNWWINNFSFGNIFYHDYYEKCIAFEKWESCFNCISSSLEREHLIKFNEVVPMFTETQLRKFIEEKSEGRLFNWFDGKEVHLYIGYFDENAVYNTKKLLQTNKSDLLQSYWQVVCKIAEEN